MKLIKTLTVIACAFAFVATTAMADDAKPAKLPGCCAKAKKAGKECDHPCCVEAKKEGKTCEKCAHHGKKKEGDAKKEESK